MDEHYKCGHQKLVQVKHRTGEDLGEADLTVVGTKDLPWIARVLVFTHGQIKDEGAVRTRLDRRKPALRYLICKKAEKEGKIRAFSIDERSFRISEAYYKPGMVTFKVLKGPTMRVVQANIKYIKVGRGST